MNNESQQIYLPKLAFGETESNVVYSLDYFMSNASVIFPKLKYYDALGQKNDFACKSASVNINGLTIWANVNTPIDMNIGENDSLNLLLSFYGNNVSVVESQNVQWGISSKLAMFLPKCERGGSSTIRSNINLVLQPEKILSICQTDHARFLIQAGWIF